MTMTTKPARDTRFWVKAKKRTHDGPDRAFILCRQSITKGDTLSLEDQERVARAYAERQGYAVVGVHHSPNTRGWQEERADHDLIRDLASRGEIETVLSYDVSRTARSLRILETLAEDLERCGVRLEFAAQEMANTNVGRQMIGMFAELETMHRSTRLRDSWLTRRRLGQWHGRAPYGYRRQDRTIVPDPVEADTARAIFARALDGWGVVRLRDWLIAEKIPTRHGGQWNESMLSRMLRNPVYCGALRIDGETYWPDGKATAGLRRHPAAPADYSPDLISDSPPYDGSSPADRSVPCWHEPLIDRADWDRLQTLLTTHAKRRSKPVASFLETLVRHQCGSPMYLVGTSTPRGTLLPVFRCKRRFKADRCPYPHGEVAAHNLEDAARTALLTDRAGVLTAEQVWKELRSDDERRRAEQRRALVNRRRASVEAKRVRAEEMRLAGDRPFAWWQERDRAYAAELSALAAEAAALPDTVDRLSVERVAAIITAAPEHPPSDDALALSMRELGIVAVVGEGGISMRYPDSLARFFPSPVTVRIKRARSH